MKFDSFWKKEILVIGIFISLIVLFYNDFDLVIPLDTEVNIGTTPVKSIPILPLIFSFILLLPLYWWAYHRPHEGLKHYQKEDLKSIFKVFLLIYGIIMIFRTIILLKYGLPLEKTPMIFFIGLQIIFIEKYFLSDFGFHSNKLWKNIAFTFVLLFVIGFLLIAILGTIILGLSLTGILNLNTLFESSININLYVIASFPFQLICVAVSEELLFRGYFYTKLRSTNIGYVRSILISSIFFGLFHVCWYISPSSPWFISDINQMTFHVGYTFIFGVCMCIIYERTKSLIAPLIIHGLGNSFGGSITTSSLFGMPIYTEIWLIGFAVVVLIPMFFIFVIWILPCLTKWTGVEATISQ